MATTKKFNAIDRIGEIANGFQQGISNYSTGVRQQQAQELQAEATRRQQAMDALNVEAKITETTGRNAMGSGIGAKILSSGSYSPEEIAGLGLTPKFENEQAKMLRDQKRQEKEMQKLEREEAEAAKPYNKRDSYLEKMDLAKTRNAGKQEKLPIETDTQIRTYAKKNADSKYIVGLLDGFLKEAENYTDDQLLMQGDQLIKTLNSTISADATGAEEVKRLGRKLQFAMGNFTNSNPTQFGRDLPGFKQQVMDTRNIMTRAIEGNEGEISRLRGGTVSQPLNIQQATPSNVAPEIIERVKTYTPEQAEARKAQLRAKGGQ